MERGHVVSATKVSFRTDSETKAEAMSLFADLGLDLSTAINMFLRQSIACNGLPFTPHRENSHGAVARAEAESRAGATFSSVSDLMDDLTGA